MNLLLEDNTCGATGRRERRGFTIMTSMPTISITFATTKVKLQISTFRLIIEAVHNAFGIANIVRIIHSLCTFSKRLNEMWGDVFRIIETSFHHRSNGRTSLFPGRSIATLVTDKDTLLSIKRLGSKWVIKSNSRNLGSSSNSSSGSSTILGITECKVVCLGQDETNVEGFLRGSSWQLETNIKQRAEEVWIHSSTNISHVIVICVHFSTNRTVMERSPLLNITRPTTLASFATLLFKAERTEEPDDSITSS